MKFRRRILLIAIVIISVPIIWWLSRPVPIPVKLHTVEQGAVEDTVTNTRTGTITACRRAQIVPIVNGRVEKLLVAKGAQVKAGQLLIELWNADIKAQSALTDSEIKSARALAEESCLRAEQAQRDAERINQLKQRGLVSEESHDQAINTARATQAACNAARASVDVSAGKLKVLAAELERTQLKAPFDGIVADIHAELGEVLAPVTALGEYSSAVDIIEEGCLYVSTPIDEIDVPAIKPGLTAYVTLDAFPKQRFAGVVSRIAPYVLDLEKQARTVEVEVELRDPEVVKQLQPGYSADVEIVLDRRENVLWVPTSAIHAGNVVWVYDEGQGVLHKRTVTAGLKNWQTTEVTDGLKLGERIVLPTEKREFTDGMAVVPQAQNNQTQ
ncbi:MAG: efflux RND transporter periplasmic adaptor subunit [Pseudomonadota bacterium]